MQSIRNLQQLLVKGIQAILLEEGIRRLVDIPRYLSVVFFFNDVNQINFMSLIRKKSGIIRRFLDFFGLRIKK